MKKFFTLIAAVAMAASMNVRALMQCRRVTMLILVTRLLQ